MHTTKHSKERMIQRVNGVNSFVEAKRIAKIAWTSGQTISKYQEYPKFFSYLQKKRDQSRECTIRVYRDNIFIWKGNRHKLVTVHSIPDKFTEEIK